MTQMLSGGPFRMFRLTDEPDGLGLSCTPGGVSLAGVPLLRKTQAGFVPRPDSEIACLLKAAYGEKPLRSGQDSARSRGLLTAAMSPSP
jgi:hypothetical protein